MVRGRNQRGKIERENFAEKERNQCWGDLVWFRMLSHQKLSQVHSEFLQFSQVGGLLFLSLSLCLQGRKERVKPRTTQLGTGILYLQFSHSLVFLSLNPLAVFLGVQLHLVCQLLPVCDGGRHHDTRSPEFSPTFQTLGKRFAHFSIEYWCTFCSFSNSCSAV